VGDVDHADQMTDLRQRVPGHSLIDELLRQWDVGSIRVDGNRVVIDEAATGWYRGVLGERRVAAELSGLGSDWTVLHSVPVGRGTSDIDHVAISQAGVFTINTKFSPGKKVWVAGYGMYVGGHKQPYVKNSLTEARRASELLSRATDLTVPVTGLIVFVDPAQLTLKAPAGGGTYDHEIRVIRAGRLAATVSGRPIFSVAQVAVIVDAAVRPATWHASPAPSSAGAHITSEFEALEQAVGPQLGRPIRTVTRPRSGSPRAHPAPALRRAPRVNRTRTRRSASPLRRTLTGLIMPAIGLIIAWSWLNSLAER
jgi:hypothetical protein